MKLYSWYNNQSQYFQNDETFQSTNTPLQTRNEVTQEKHEAINKHKFVTSSDLSVYQKN